MVYLSFIFLNVGMDYNSYDGPKFILVIICTVINISYLHELVYEILWIFKVGNKLGFKDPKYVCAFEDL